MGRTSKFTFPVPGKRQKHQSTIGPIVSNPMSKAQRILGAAELNIDAPKQWDEASNSGISVSVSDHTSAYTATERGYRRTEEPADEGHGGYNSGSRGVKSTNRWEMESETVPAHVHSGRGMHGEDTAREYMSDASSVRRRQSNSTLKSWYDKSKMPLSISQQTSSSAMAKGLPAKASALLDVDGSGAADNASNASQATKVAKRPSRLNLSHLLHGGRHREQHLQPSPSSGSLRSQDFSRSPSIASSYSPDTLVTSPRTPRRLVKKPTKERLAAEAAAAAAAEQAPTHRRGSGSTQGEGGGLHAPRDLYDHYERTAFRDILESPAEEAADPFDEEAAATKELISDFPAAPVGPTPLRSPSYPRSSTASSNPVIKEPRHEHDEARRGSEASTKASSYSIHSGGHFHLGPDRDYASSLASVSSRHTKTSKASKRTNPSITESDRQERSVLSLSSDSEEDYETGADTASKSATSISSYSRSPIDAPPSPASVSRKSVGSRGESISDTASRKSGKRASFAATHTYLTVPAGSSPSNLKPTSINPRTSSVNRGGQPPSARMSTISASSNASAEWQKTYGVHEAKAVAVHSVASTASSLQGVAQAHHHEAPSATEPQPPARQSLRSGDQPTPPLSPSSVEFCLQPDMSFDVAEGSRTNPRFMAVTRQEQMLLAALRNKRAMMRENIIAEFEGEQLPGSSPHAEPAAPRSSHKHTSSQATIRGPQADDGHRPNLRHQLSSTSTSTITSASRASEKRREASSSAAARAPPSSNGHRVRSDSRGTRSNTGDYSSPASSRSHSGARETRSQTSLSHRQHATRAHDHHHGSDRADFASFDDIPSEEEEEEEPSPYGPRSQQKGLSPAGSLRNARSRSSSSKASSVRWRPTHEGKKPLAARVVEEEDGPRPDSPARMLAPPPAGMDRKKAVRLSAVGRAGPEVGWWGDDG